CERRQRQHAPGEGELAIVVMPQPWKQQRADRNGEQNSDKGQRPWPAQRCAIERDGSLRLLGREGGKQCGRDEDRLPHHRDCHAPKAHVRWTSVRFWRRAMSRASPPADLERRPQGGAFSARSLSPREN